MTYAQSIVKLEDIRLPGLDGMLPGAKVKGREKAVLEYLVEAEKVIREEYLDQLKGRDRQIIKTYFQIYEKLKTDLLRDVDFSDRDILTYIDYRVETEGQFKTDEKDELDAFFGLYTGCLLSILTERNEEAGLPTSVYFDGKGREIPYLFYCAHKVDELIVNNLSGGLHLIGSEATCCAIGGFGGYANHIMVVNSKGVNCLNNVGLKGGKIGTVSVINHDGDSLLLSRNLAAGVAKEKGNVGMLLLSGCNADEAIPGLAKEGGSIGMVLATHQKSSDFAQGLGRTHSNVGLAVMDEVDCNYFGGVDPKNQYRTDANVKKLLVSNSPKITDLSYAAEEIILKDESPERWDEIMQEYNIAQLIKQLTSVTKDSSKEEIMEVASQIKAIYELTKPKLDKLLEK